MSTSAQARERASVIMEVRSGKMTVEDGARKLRVSRKTYYEIENRALMAMMGAVQNHRAGRPKKVLEPEKKQLKDQVRALEKELALSRMKLKIQYLVEELRNEPQKAIKKKLDTKAGENVGDHRASA